jgi:putative tricarboxylic transport membrane protein
MVRDSGSRAALLIGLALFFVAAVTAWDASNMRQLGTYGVGPNYASYLVAVIFALLGSGHVYQAFRGTFPSAAEADWPAVGWVAVALVSLIVTIQVNAGFILAASLLFAFTARALGRRALIADFFIGVVLATLVFLLFNNLLTLELPAGPLERLF